MDILSRWHALSEGARIRFCLGLVLSLGAETGGIPMTSDPHGWDELLAAGLLQHSPATPDSVRLTRDGTHILMELLQTQLFAAPALV
jgi:hypothetical protein